ncbi:hypothetical protein V7x_33580 [Crateriforma conspicua]|uniref:Uncharacterized protein n=1 Tax=Crateriforma conspicua TaxID=2527996 RepID=A0A5C6FHW6_9PLAN|nr:hypothetical protein [Crateriforma conspicua]TWU61670.1 hypothetical protein V7x_33580 [Crateriforma conspicua]
MRLTNSPRRPAIRRRLMLGIAVTVLATIWLVVLPAVAKRPAVRQRVEWLKSEGIDPSAMYYTELDRMEWILQQRRAEELAGRSTGFPPATIQPTGE